MAISDAPGAPDEGQDGDVPPALAADGSLGERLRDHRIHVAVVLALVVYPPVYSLLTTAPVVGPALDVILPRITTMITVLYVGLFAMSFDFISGYTGYLSFGHAMFYGTGAYFVLLAAEGMVPGVAAGTPFLLLVLLAAVLAALVAAVVGAVSFRLTGVYFAMVTLGFAEIANVFVSNWNYLGVAPESGVQHGEGFAVLGVRIGALVGDSFYGVFGPLGMSESVARATVSFYVLGALVLICYFALQRIVHSPFGRVMVAIRENEERARAVGYNTFYYKLGAFSISAFFAGIAGAVFAGYERSAAPENSFDLFVTADALLAAIIGGFGTLAGPLYGQLFHETLDGVLSTESDGLARYLQGALPESVLAAEVAGFTLNEAINSLLAGRADLYLGVVFILFVLYVPEGILGTLRERLGGTVAEKLPEHLDRYRRR